MILFFTNAGILFAQQEAWRIDSSGNIGIGTAPSASFKLNVAGNTNISGDVGIGGDVIVGTPGRTTTLSINGRIKDQAGYLVPVGGIIMYTGVFANLFDGSGRGKPGTQVEGWAICDGRNGSPNLIDRFIVGTGRGSIYGETTGTTGGEAMVTLKVDQMPKHQHAGFGEGFEDTWPLGTSKNDGKNNWGSSGGRDHDNYYYNTTNAGGNEPHENRPPYYALFYIMKL